jgi:uncharacterized Fe-S center protein
MQKKDTGAILVAEASFQDMHLETIAVVHHPGTNFAWQSARTVRNIGVNGQTSVRVGRTRCCGKSRLQHDCRSGLQKFRIPAKWMWSSW